MPESDAQKELRRLCLQQSNDEVHGEGLFRNYGQFGAIVARLRDGGNERNDQLSEADRREHTGRPVFKEAGPRVSDVYYI